MSFNKIKSLLGLGGGSQPAKTEQPASQQHPDLPIIPAGESPWGIQLLDIRPVTLGMLATSADPQCATNAVSFGAEDGLVFVGQPTRVARTTEAHLQYRTDGYLAEGVLFTPRTMEHKWAIFHHQKTIICVRSWLRLVAVVAHVESGPGTLFIRRIDGSFSDGGEPASLTCRLLDYLLYPCAGYFLPGSPAGRA